MIVVTGGAGFIGSNLAHRLAGLGESLWLVDHPITAAKAVHWVGLETFRFSTHTAFLDELVPDDPAISAIFHLGACSATTETNWDYLATNNVGYTRRLWEWSAAAGKPFYYASSAATYGDGSLGFDDRTPPEALTPLNLYGRSKNDFDRWALAEVAAGRPTPAGWAGLKFFNVYGPRESHKGSMASVVWHARRQILATGEVKLFASDDPGNPAADHRRDFVFVGDCVDHLLWLHAHPAVTGLFNSGTGTARTFDDLARAVFAAMGRDPVIKTIPMPDHLVGRYQSFTRADTSKLVAAGYPGTPTSLEAGAKVEVEFEDAREGLRRD